MNLVATMACLAKNWAAVNRGRAWRRKSVAVALIAVAASVAVMQSYAWLADAGHMGDFEQRRYRGESQHELGVLGSGRISHVVGGLIAVSESPIIGYGSWPLDRYGFYFKVCEFFGTKPIPGYYKLGYPAIPSHSHIVSAWVEHGILAVPFWLYVLFVASRAIFAPIADPKRLQLWVLTAAVATLWNVLFSPISYRMELSMTLVIFITQYLDWKRGRNVATAKSGPWQARVTRQSAAPAAA
jgi:hypothetical protein